jgi:type I restriction enzyme S subunit
LKQKAEDPATYKRAKAGDIAFNKMRMWQGAVGVAPIDGLVSPDYVVAKPLDGVNPRYFEHLFRTEQYKTEVNRHSHGIVDDRNRLYWEGFKQIKSVVPPYSEQREIVRWIGESCSKLDALIAKAREGSRS